MTSRSLNSLIQKLVLQPNSGQMQLIDEACTETLAAILFTRPFA